MSIFTNDIVKDVVGGVFGIIDDLHTSEEEKAEIKFRITALAKEADIAQIRVNQQEAKSGRLFVSGWRPFVGWVCGSALAWTFVLSPIVMSLAFYVAEFNGTVIDLSGLPQFDLAVLMPVLLGMLGLGSLRTYEKVQGAARESLGAGKPTPDAPGAKEAQRKAKAAMFRKGRVRGS